VVHRVRKKHKQCTMPTEHEKLKKTKLEVDMHHLRGSAIPAGPLSDFDENLFFDRFLSLSVLFSDLC